MEPEIKLENEIIIIIIVAFSGVYQIWNTTS